MSTFQEIRNKILVGTLFSTPSGRSTFFWSKSDELKVQIKIGSKKTLLTIPSDCFDKLPEFIMNKEWVLIGATHGTPPKGSVDEFLQQFSHGTSVASYVVPIFEKMGIIEVSKNQPKKIHWLGNSLYLPKKGT